jgi:hypothetical protein
MEDTAMTVKHFTAGAFALLLLFGTTARAQQAQTTTTTQTTQTTQTTTPTTTTTTTQNVYTPTPAFSEYRNIVTGTVGGAWAGDLDSGSWAFEGQYAYMMGGLGFEFIGSFMADAKLTAFENLAITNPILSNNLTRSTPRVNSYMANLVAGLPFGRSTDWMPFVSGGLGMFHISGGRVDFDILNDELDLDLIDPDFEPEFDSDGLVKNFFKDNQFGGNIGLGVFGFFDQVGFRADVRYYTGIANNEGDNLKFVAQNIKDISFWRSTAGVSFRW